MHYFTFGYIFQHPSFKYGEHLTTFSSERCKVLIAGVSCVQEALLGTENMIKEGAQFIELSASLGPVAAYKLMEQLQLHDFPIGAVVFDLASSPQVSEAFNKQHVNWTFVLQGPGLNPKIHSERFFGSGVTVSVIGVNMDTPMDGVRVALTQRVDFVEMCGGFGPRYAYMVKMRGAPFPVGAEVKGNEFRQNMIDILRPRGKMKRLFNKCAKLLRSLIGA